MGTPADNSTDHLAAVGRLAARVAHELNNPLDGSLRYINLVRKILGDDADPRATRYLEQAAIGLKRMARIVGELLEFSRSHADYGETGDVNAMVEDAIRMHAAQADRQSVIIAASFRERDMPAMEGGKLLQVFSNLIKNAIDAMPQGGCLTVTTGVCDGEVVIRFEDTGCGVGDDVERIFEPFYTTKPPGEGTGLGLAICRDYVRQMGGEISAANGSQQGAIITVTLPDTSRQAGPGTGDAAMAAKAFRKERDDG